MEQGLVPVIQSDETMQEHKEKLLAKMREEKYDALVIYADLEHGSNFEYLTGFLPRFEEALLILHSNGRAYMVMGNENLNKVASSRIEAKAIHMPHFSLPNQPMATDKSITEILEESNISELETIGLVGWKNFTAPRDNNETLYDIPHFIIVALEKLCHKAQFKNATHLFIGADGVRTTNNANDMAHYEFGAALAGNCILETMDAFEEGISEMELASNLNKYGQKNSVVTIMATGRRFEYANLYPTDKLIKRGDAISLTIGYKGGLQSRAGYAVLEAKDLPEEQRDYLKKVAIPYFAAVKTWLETIHIGMKGKELYDKIETVLPKEKYGWSLNPGHLCADEEWLSSPIYQGSSETLKSSMLFQIDIIPSISGYAGISCESGIALADESLRDEIKKGYPEMWSRVKQRRQFIIEELGIAISEEIIPMSCVTAYCRPFLLDKRLAFTAK